MYWLVLKRGCILCKGKLFFFFFVPLDNTHTPSKTKEKWVRETDMSVNTKLSVTEVQSANELMLFVMGSLAGARKEF